MANRWLVLAALLAGCEEPAEVLTDVRIVRGDPTSTWLNLSITGAELTVLDGTQVVIQIGMPDRPPERLGLAITETSDRGFTVSFPSVWELGLYKHKVILFDLDADLACDDGETVLVDFSAAVEDVDMTTADFFPGDCTEYVADWPAE
jgi:hypothetical protein